MKEKTELDYNSYRIVNDLKNYAWQIAIINIIAIIIYLFYIVLLKPNHFSSLFCATIAILVCFFPVIYSIYKKQGHLVFTCITFICIAPVWFLHLETIFPTQDAYLYSRPIDKIKAFTYVSVFISSICLIYIGLCRNLFNNSIKSFKYLDKLNISSAFYLKTTIVFFTLPLLIFYFYYGSFTELYNTITGGRTGGGSATGGLMQHDSAFGNSSAFLMPVSWMWQLTPLTASLALVKAKNKLSFASLMSFALGILVVFCFFLSGSRGNTIAVAAPMLFFLFYFNWKKGLKFWIFAFILFFLAIAIMEVQVRFRGNLLSVIENPQKASKTANIDSPTTFDPIESQRDNNMYLFCLAIKAYPNKYGYEGFNDFIATLLNPIPRAIWPNKPILSGAKEIVDQAEFIKDGPLYMGTNSLTYSVVGEAYRAKGLMGILIYAIPYALFLFYFDTLLYYTSKKNLLALGLLGLSLFLAFWGFRSFFALISFCYPLFFLLAIISLIKKNK